MKGKKYKLLIGCNLCSDEIAYSIISDLTRYELSQLLNVLLLKDIEVLIRPQEA